jgi:hypothetical protein
VHIQRRRKSIYKKADFTVNIYRTSNRVMINGPELYNTFVKTELPLIIELISISDLEKENDNIRAVCADKLAGMSRDKQKQHDAMSAGSEGKYSSSLPSPCHTHHHQEVNYVRIWQILLVLLVISIAGDRKSVV